MNLTTKIAPDTSAPTAEQWHRSAEAKALLATIANAKLTYRPHPLEPHVFPRGSGDWVAVMGTPCFACGQCQRCRVDAAIEQLHDLRRLAIEANLGVTVGPETSADEMNLYLEVSRRVEAVSAVIERALLGGGV